MTVTEPGSFPRRRDVRDGKDVRDVRDVRDIRDVRDVRGPGDVRDGRGPGGRAPQPVGGRAAAATAVRTPPPRTSPEGQRGRSAPLDERPEPRSARHPERRPERRSSREPEQRHPAPAEDDDAPLGTLDDDPRGRHASATGEGFTRLVLLTVLGAAVPGTGLIAAGRRAWGWLVLLPVLAALGAALAVLGTGRLVPLARSVVFEPTAMLALAVGAVVVALLWCVVIVTSHAGLRTAGGTRLTRGQRLASLVLVTALMVVVVAPSATAARYAMANRSLLLSVFGAGEKDGAGPDTAASNPWANVPRVNVMLLGADTGSDRVGTRPDTIIVASIDTKTGNSTLLSLPRQLEDVPFPEGSKAASLWPKACKEDGDGGCMLNAVYLFGTLHPDLFGGTANGNDPGIEATQEAVSTATGLKIDYQVTIDLEGFQQLVDAMGGLTLNVPRDIPIGGGHNLETGGKYPITGWIKKGQAQDLNGYQALWFARSREGSDNNDRMARQQCVISAAVEQYDVAALAKAFPALADAAEKNIQTNIPADELNAFVDLGQVVKGGDLRALSFTSANTDTGNPDYAALRQLVQNALYPAPAAPAAPAASAAPSKGTAAVPAPAASAPADPDAAIDPSTTC